MPDLPPRAGHLEPRVAVRLVQAVDWVVVALAAEISARWGAGVGLLDLPIGQAASFLLGAAALKLGLWVSQYYHFTPAQLRPEHGVGGLALGAVAGLILANALAFDARAAAALSASLPLAALGLAGLHAAFALWIGAAHSAGIFAENVVLIGATRGAAEFAARARKTGEARVAAIIDDRARRAPSKIGRTPVCGGVDELLAWEGLPHIDRIVIALPTRAEARVRAIIQRLRRLPHRVELLIDLDAADGHAAAPGRKSAAVCASGAARKCWSALAKRAFDVVVSAALLAFLAPALSAIALAIRLDSKGPALYRKRVLGLSGRSISIVKFRTLHRDGERSTRIGSFLRRTGLDDLPLLCSVLRGDMSLVGPRPHAADLRVAKRQLRHISADYAHRHRVKPGIIGWAQAKGACGAFKTPADVRRRLAFDLDYAARASLGFDLLILARAGVALFGGRGRAQ